MRISVAQDEAAFEEASRLLGGHFSHARGHKVMSARAADGSILAYAVFTGIGDHKAELSFWSAGAHGCGGRAFLRAVFDVAFKQWRLRRLSAWIRVSNRKSHDAARALGFIPEAQAMRWFGDEDGILYFMFPEHCKWLG